MRNSKFIMDANDSSNYFKINKVKDTVIPTQVQIVKNDWKELQKNKGNKWESIVENTDQHPIFKKLLQAINNQKFDIVMRKPYFPDGREPDFVLNKSNSAEIPFNGWFIVEILKNSLTDKPHKLKLTQYNEAMLELRPYRKEITSMLTNLKHMILIHSIREGDDIIHYESAQYGRHILFVSQVLAAYILNIKLV